MPSPLKVIELRGEELVQGGIGAGIGVFLGEFIGEYITRSANMVGPGKAMTKAITKGILGVILITLATGMTGPVGFIMTTAAYGTIGSIVIDAIRLMIPGGEAGAAEWLARATRAAFGAEKVSTALSRIESIEKEEQPAQTLSTVSIP